MRQQWKTCTRFRARKRPGGTTLPRLGDKQEEHFRKAAFYTL